MPIIVKDRLFQLDTRSSSYQFAADEHGVLVHTYYGRRIYPESRLDLIVRTDMGFSGNPADVPDDRTYSLDTLPLEASFAGAGDYREPMLAIRWANGARSADFRFESYHIEKGSYTLPGLPALYDTEDEKAETLAVVLREVSGNARLTLLYSVFENQDLLTRAALVQNTGSEPFRLERMLSMSVDLAAMECDFVCFSGRHAMERTPEAVPVGHTGFRVGSRRGTSSHHYNPAFLLRGRGADETSGECWGFCLAYSGSFEVGVQADSRGQLRVQAGIQSDGFEWKLEPGESFAAPQVLIGFSGEGLGALSRRYHAVLREHMCRGAYKHRKRPVLVNNWEATYFDFDREKLLDIAREAAGLGIGMLVLDDGWFGRRDSDCCALGDWFVNEKKLGGSLESFGRELNRLGLQFGLWFEPEMVSEDSDLYRAHPDWAVAVPGRGPCRSRSQLVLDMTRADVRDWLSGRMHDLLSSAPVAYVKWDMNRSICDAFSAELPPERMGEFYHRYVLGLYELQERLLRAFPELLLEGCSGGGGRFDAGMLYYSPQIWCSDNTDAVNRLAIQYGTSFFYPVSSFGAHVSACPNHQTGRSVPFDTRAAVALSGSFGYELDLCRLTAGEKQAVRRQLQQFDRFYTLTHEGDYYRLSAPGGAWMAWAFAAPDKSELLVCAVVTEREGNEIPLHLPLAGFEPGTRYRLEPGPAAHSRTFYGETWNNSGLTLEKIPAQYESVLLHFVRVQ